MRYGIPYMGSKNLIAEKIVAFLPSGKRFVDLFGGGFAMSHCALLSGKYESVFYNEINPLLPKLIKEAIDGKYNPRKFKPEFITREKFFAENDAYVKYIWSFGNKGNTYLFAREIEDIKRQGHAYCVDKTPIDGIPNCDSDDIFERRKFLNRFCKKEFAARMAADSTLKEKHKEYCNIIFSKFTREVALRFTRWLRSTGIKAAEVKRLTDSEMASHYLSNGSQPAVPTVETWEKLLQSPALQRAEIPQWVRNLFSADDAYKADELRKLGDTMRLEQLERLQQLEQLERLQQLEQLERLQQLQQLERLQQLEQLEQIGNILSLNCGSYVDYKYQRGDVVYCDPPYEGTAQYDESGFDHKAFYDWVFTQPYPVYFSSHEITDGRFRALWSAKKRSLLNSAKSYLLKEECIYGNRAAQEFERTRSLNLEVCNDQ